jgi:DNA polymerase III delta prime subunit
MSFIQQKNKFKINHSENKTKQINSLFPNNIRCLISGPSGCGKTVILYNLIVQKEGLKFTNLYIISQSLEQEKYKNIIKIFELCDEIKLYTSSKCDLTPQDIEKYSAIVFDDINCENIAPFFSMGRHRNINCFYLCQSYSKVQKYIRDNVNFLILFKQDDLNLKHIYNNHVGNDFTFKKFRELCYKCWNQPFGFLVIDKTKAFNNGKYRFTFDQFYYVPEQEC